MTAQQCRQVWISVSKIFNWTETTPITNFQLHFISPKTQSLIIKKLVKGIPTTNTMMLNCFLKINYTAQQNTLILILNKLNGHKVETLGDFQINLDNLKQKNVQYFPFGSKDKVLQVDNAQHQIYQQSYCKYTKQQKMRNHGKQKQRNGQMQWSRLMRYQPQMKHKAENMLNRGKKSFSQKVFRLLQEVKSIRSNRQERNGDLEKRVRSQKELLFSTPDKDRQVEIQPITQVKIKQSNRNRLLLNSLNIVPCNQYYLMNNLDYELN